MYVDGLDADKPGWNRTGSTPYADYIDYDVNYVDSNTPDEEIGDFTIEDTAQGGYPTVVEVALYCRQAAGGDDQIEIFVDDGVSGFVSVGRVTPDEAWSFKTIDVSSVLDTFTKVNAAKLYWVYRQV